MRNARLDLRLPAEQKERWRRQSDLHGADLSEVVRRATDLYFKLWETIPPGDTPEALLDRRIFKRPRTPR